MTTFTMPSDGHLHRQYKYLRDQIVRGALPLDHAIPLDKDQENSPLWTIKEFCAHYLEPEKYDSIKATLVRKALEKMPFDHPEAPKLRKWLMERDRSMNNARVGKSRAEKAAQRAEYKRQLAAVQPVSLGSELKDPTEFLNSMPPLQERPKSRDEEG